MLVLRGSLMKQSDFRLRWRPRVFFLYTASLSYFESNADAALHELDPASKPPKGLAMLRGASVTPSRASRAGRPAFTFAAAAPRAVRWTLAARSAEEAAAWLRTLAKLGVAVDAQLLPDAADGAPHAAPPPPPADDVAAHSVVFLTAAVQSAAEAALALLTRELPTLARQPLLAPSLAVGACWAWLRPGGAWWTETELPPHPPPQSVRALAASMGAALAPACCLQRGGAAGRLLVRALSRLPDEWAEREPVEFAVGVLMALLLVLDVGPVLAHAALGLTPLAALLPQLVAAFLFSWLPYWCVVTAEQQLPVRVSCCGAVRVSPAAWTRVFAASWCGAFTVQAALLRLLPAAALAVVLSAAYQLLRAAVLAVSTMLACIGVTMLAAHDEDAWFELRRSGAREIV
ncbi:hypothetical protein AB1Y20_015628 [Prymnesium parvum]|uniref:PH domain-containing protein n=1 Tax=Prymnesium parvum TaxID=97485 RepID=A0AB34K1F1_PRYPA